MMSLSRRASGIFFNNYGKTAAILKEVRDFMTIADAFPDRYDLNIRNLPDELLIQPGKESAIFLTQCKPFTVGDAVAFQKKGKPIWLYEYVRFADAFGQEAVLRFRYQYQRGFGGLRLVWYEETPRTRPNEDRE